MPLIGDFGGKVEIYRFLLSPPIPRMLPSLFNCRDFFSFCPFNLICCVSSLFWSTKRRVWKYNSLKFEEIPFMKNCGITLIRGKNETLGRQRKFEIGFLAEASPKICWSHFIVSDILILRSFEIFELWKHQTCRHEKASQYL